MKRPNSTENAMQRHYYVIHSLLINSTCLTNDNKSSIKLLHQEKGWGTEGICKEFPNKKWSVSSVKDLLRKTDATNSICRKAGSERPRTVRMAQNVKRVAELICSQEDNPGSSKSPREIQKMTGISLSSCLLYTSDAADE